MAKIRKIVSRSHETITPSLGLPHVTLECGHIAFYSMEQMKRAEQGKDIKRKCEKCE